MEIYQLNKQLLYILQIPDILYSPDQLKKMLIKKLNKKHSIYFYISNDLQTFMNLSNNYYLIDKLVEIIILNYSENTNKPNYDYYSYDQKPDYKKIEYTTY